MYLRMTTLSWEQFFIALRFDNFTGFSEWTYVPRDRNFHVHAWTCGYSV